MTRCTCCTATLTSIQLVLYCDAHLGRVLLYSTDNHGILHCPLSSHGLQLSSHLMAAVTVAKSW